MCNVTYCVCLQIQITYLVMYGNTFENKATDEGIIVFLFYFEAAAEVSDLSIPKGKAFLGKNLHRAGLLVLSSRISYELVQKSARAGLAIMISNSRPTALAVDMGKSLNMTMAFPAGENELMVVCGAHRILGN